MPDPQNAQDQQDDELATLLSDPQVIRQIVASDPFKEWNVEYAINGIYFSPEEGAMVFLYLHPDYIVDLRDTVSSPRIITPTPLPPLPPDLPDLWRSFLNSDWLRNNVQEPKISGHSVLRQMLVQPPDPTDASVWICGVPIPNGICGKTFRRPDRAVTHIRRHLNHRPYPCDGGCGVPTWCVTP
jgi:hypothetical protein